jgi:hypothetical protein
MFYLIEKASQLSNLIISSDCFVDIVTYNDNFHPIISSKNRLSLVYVRPIEGHKGYIISIDHSEALSISKEIVWDFLSKQKVMLWVLDKKEWLYYYPHAEKLFDINFIEKVDLTQLDSNAINFFYSKHNSLSNINCIIPISKHYEKLEAKFEKVKPIIKKFDPKAFNISFSVNNGELTRVFYEIESNGLKVDKENYIKNYGELDNPEFNLYRGRLYSQYHLYTTTGRPSNSFNNINFAALDKSNGERDCITARNDELVEMDFEAYHPRLIAEMVHFDFGSTNPYEFLAKTIFNSTVEEAKELTFKQLYGGIRQEYLNSDYFSKVDQYVKYCWQLYNEGKGFNTGIRIFEQDKTMNPMKLFNYFVQSVETQRNVDILKLIINYLKTKKTKIILYTYDAFLFDYAQEDGEETIEELKNIMQFPVRVKRGKTYGGLVKE